MTLPPVIQRQEAEVMGKSLGKDDQKVKVTLLLPERLTKDAKIYAVEHDMNLQDVVAKALLAYLVGRAKGGA